MKLDPIIPFEPVQVDDIPEGSEWVFQTKWDGVRILTYFDGESIRLFNRKTNERTMTYPEIAACDKNVSAGSFILDGEAFAPDKNGRPSFHEIMKRDRWHTNERIGTAVSTIPVYYMVFDLLYYNGEWLTEYPLSDRLNQLSAILEPSTHIRLTPSWDDGQTLFQTIKQLGMEGIVAKKKQSVYSIGGKNANWRKIKNYKDLTAVVGGVSLRESTTNALLIGLYNPDQQLVYIGHCGPGKLTMEEWKVLDEFMIRLESKHSPFVNYNKDRDVRWVLPKITVKVQYIEWQEGHDALRQPVLQAIVREDVRACRLNPQNQES